MKNNPSSTPIFIKPKLPKYTNKYEFLSIYQPRQTLNDSNFHYFTQQQPGFQKISIHRKSSRKPMTMYYEHINNQQNQQNTKQILPKIEDNSTVIDFSYFSIRENITEQNIIDRSKMMRDSQWVKKYQPKKFIQLLTDDKINRNMLTWLKTWDPIIFNKTANVKKQSITPMIFNRNLSNINKPLEPTNINGHGNNYYENIFQNPKKIILLAGPPGCGKTTLMRVLALHCKYQIVEINASDDRSAQNLIGKLQDICNNDTIRGNKKPALICLDQIDGVADGQANGIGKILEYIESGKKGKRNQDVQDKQYMKQSKQRSKINITYTQKKHPQQKQKTQPAKPNPHNTQYQNNKYNKSHNTINNHLNRPIIFICNDPYAKSLKQLRSKAHIIYFTQLHSDRVIKRMRQILQKQKVYIQLPVLQKICQICKNDIRSCIGILELVAKQKIMNNKNPKDIVNRMKLSFTKDNQSSINQFLLSIFTKRIQAQYDLKNSHASTSTFIKYIQNQVMQIYNPSLLMQTFLQNILNIGGILRKGKVLLNLYKDLVTSDMLIRNGFKHNNELEIYHSLPYLGFCFNFGNQDIRKIEFPSGFFERLRKHKFNSQLLNKIYTNFPVQIKIFLRKQSAIGSYLLALYLAMQSSTTKQLEIIRCVSVMLTYGFTLKKQKQNQSNYPIFNPQIDLLLGIGQKKPQILISNIIRSLIDENYEFFKERKQILSDNELKDNTTAMINQMHLHSRKKRPQENKQGLKYRFVEGTGTKTTYNITMDFFF